MIFEIKIFHFCFHTYWFDLVCVWLCVCVLDLFSYVMRKLYAFIA